MTANVSCVWADFSELPAPGNHHDSLFLPYLVQLGRAIGLDIRVVVTDEGYADAEQNPIRFT